MARDQAPPQAVSNIETIARLEEQHGRERSPGERVAAAVGRFVGTLPFVAAQTLFVAAWVAVNCEMIPGVPAFDPYPFSLLGSVASLEGVVLAAFVLVRQNHASLLAERRSHLDLQIGLLSETESTKIIQMLERLSCHLGITEGVTDAETHELGEHTAVETLVRELKERLPGSRPSHAELRDREDPAGD